MKFRIADDRGQPLDANVELGPSAIIVLSRGGTAGSGNSQNQDYPTALRLILQRLRSTGREITGAWVDSVPARALPRAERQMYFPEDGPADAKALFSLFGRRMERVAKAPESIPNKGNRNKRLRIEVATTSVGELSAVVGAIADAGASRSSLRLPAKELRRVTAAHVWSAIDRLSEGLVGHDFDEALEYELITETGEAFPPKAVFGLAASEALGFPVQPVHLPEASGRCASRYWRRPVGLSSARGAPLPVKTVRSTMIANGRKVTVAGGIICVASDTRALRGPRRRKCALFMESCFAKIAGSTPSTRSAARAKRASRSITTRRKSPECRRAIGRD